jgi:hypothetical protein
MVIHQVVQGDIWASSNYAIYKSRDEGITFKEVAGLRVPLLTQMLGKFRLPARTFRLGIRCLRRLKSGTILIVADKKVFRLEDGEFEVVYSFNKGLGPLREGLCEDIDGNCYLGEYFLNNKRNAAVNLLKSEDDGRSWKIIRSLRHIRHIHCVQFDQFSGKIWMGTGDRDEECNISFSEDEGKSWSEIGAGNQMFRAVSLMFTEDHVYWGSDAPTRQNYLYRYVRRIGRIERLVAVDGPVYYSTCLNNSMKLFATTVEGNSEGRSAEWDKKAHIWASKDGTRWEDIASWEKDLWPYILGFGTVLFAHGQHNKDAVFFTTQCLKKVDNTSFCAVVRYENESQQET